MGRRHHQQDPEGWEERVAVDEYILLPDVEDVEKEEEEEEEEDITLRQ